MYLSFPAPAASPVNFTGYTTSSSQLLLSWSPPPPEHQNGQIQYYEISVIELQTGAAFSLRMEDTDNADTIESAVPGLHPFYDYSSTVAAVTVEVGPESNAVTLKTFEDG